MAKVSSILLAVLSNLLIVACQKNLPSNSNTMKDASGIRGDLVNSTFLNTYSLAKRVVSISFIRDRSLCGGAIVDSFHIRTNAHCFDDDQSAIKHPDKFLDVHQLLSPSNRLEIVQVQIDPLYSHAVDVFRVAGRKRLLQQPSNDSAILTLKIGLSDISSLNPSPPLNAKTPLLAFGFCDAKSGFVSTFARWTVKQVEEVDPSHNLLFIKTMERDFCKGDSGSPAFTSIDGVIYIAGYLSHLSDYDDGSQLTIYTM